MNATRTLPEILQRRRLHRLRKFLRTSALPPEVRCEWAASQLDLLLSGPETPTKHCLMGSNGNREQED